MRNEVHRPAAQSFAATPSAVAASPTAEKSTAGAACSSTSISTLISLRRAPRLIARTRPETGDTIAAYAFARTGYHRGLDQLRRNGWKGFGPVPFDHEPNQGFLRCVAVLARAAQKIDEVDEYERCLELLHECDPHAASALGLA